MCAEAMNGMMAIAVVGAWVLDLLLGDPRWMPHPVVLFGKMIAWGERRLNHHGWQRTKGAVMAVALVMMTFVATGLLLHGAFLLSPWIGWAVTVVLTFQSLAGTTLIREVREVFVALDGSLDDGRRQVSRIVGRDTSRLSAQKVRAAALETLAENLSDGVVAPLFWLALLGVPGMLAYKMINTLDSMIGYHTERYLRFGCWAARIDDVANWLPARLTALLMVMTSSVCLWKKRLRFVMRYGRCHASPNSGYPESALAAILNCRFGGPHDYFGQRFDKPFIGNHERQFTTLDATVAIGVNRKAEVAMIVIVVAVCLWHHPLLYI